MFDINTYQALEGFMNNCEITRKKFIGEINNNKNTAGSDREYLIYLQTLKNEFTDYFDADSINNHSEKNLRYFKNDYVKYTWRVSEKENNILASVFKSSISDAAIESFENASKDFQNKEYRFRQLGFLPYTKFPYTYKEELISSIVSNGYAEDVHLNVEKYHCPANIPNDAIRHLVTQLLLYDVEQVKTHLLWLVIGNLIDKIETIEAAAAGMEKYFKDYKDIRTILDALRNANIIDDTNRWLGVKILKGRQGKVVEDLDKSRSAVASLIECLDSKKYLLPGDKTSIGRAFAKSFHIKISDRQLRNLPNEHSQFYHQFDKIIPPRN
jgi:hypothetical protein